MSTRSITHIYEMQEIMKINSRPEPEIVCSFYRHCDGYPESHGQDLVDWLKGKHLVNGIDLGKIFSPQLKIFNRSGTMAVQLMAHIQNVSGCEVIPTGDSDRWEEYTYHITFENDEFHIKTVNYSLIEHKSTIDKFDAEELNKLFDEDEDE